MIQFLPHKLISFLDVKFFYKTDLKASLVPAVSQNNQLKICQWSTIFGDGIFWSPAVIFGVASSESQHIPPLCIPGTLRAIGSKPCLSSAAVAPSGGEPPIPGSLGHRMVDLNHRAFPFSSILKQCHSVGTAGGPRAQCI